jgi:hypothetical protein
VQVIEQLGLGVLGLKGQLLAQVIIKHFGMQEVGKQMILD